MIYEAERIFIICLVTIYTAIYSAELVVQLVRKVVARNWRKIQTGLSARHIRLYVIIQLAVQAVADMVKVTSLVAILAAAAVLVSITFVSVKLGHELPIYLVVVLASAGVFGFLMAKALLTKAGRMFKNLVELLGSFKGVEILKGMTPSVKMAYMRDVGRLSLIKIPIGVGNMVFATVNRNTNVDLSRLFIDATVNVLLLF